MILQRRGLVLALSFASTFLGLDAAAARSFEYLCEDGSKLAATFSPPEQAEGMTDLVFADGRKLSLPQAISADGGRYVKDEVEFWIKGKGAMLTIAGKTTNCATQD